MVYLAAMCNKAWQLRLFALRSMMVSCWAGNKRSILGSLRDFRCDGGMPTSKFEKAKFPKTRHNPSLRLAPNGISLWSTAVIRF